MEWRPFNTHAFLKESKHWEEKRREILLKLEEISELPAIDNKTGIKSGKISDLTKQTAMKKIELEGELKKIDRNEEMLQYALGTLDGRERALIDGFYFSRKQRSIFVWEYGRKYGLCKDYVYAERERILKELGNRIIEKYYGAE